MLDYDEYISSILQEKRVCYHNYQGSSLIEIVVTLLIFSISSAVISNQINRDIGGMNAMKNHIAEIYRHEI